MEKIIFLGTSHIDPDGCRNLKNALLRLRPAVILLEVSPLSVLLRKTLGVFYLKILEQRLARSGLDVNSEIRSVKGYLGLPFEYTAARDYCRSTGARFRLIDVSLFTFVRFIHAHKLIGKKNLRILSSVTGDRFEQEKNIAARIFREGDIGALRFSPGNWFEALRERILTERIARYYARYGKERVVYIGGWEHLIDITGNETLFARIGAPKEREIVFI